MDCKKVQMFKYQAVSDPSITFIILTFCTIILNYIYLELYDLHFVGWEAHTYIVYVPI